MSGCQFDSPILISWPLFYDSDNVNKVEVFEIRNFKKHLDQEQWARKFQKVQAKKTREIK